MTIAQKTIIIQDLQCKVASWLEKYNKALGLGQCPDKYHATAVQVSNLINVLYRYNALEQDITNADKITINIIPGTEVEDYTITISYGAVLLGSYFGQGTQESIATALKDAINSGTEIHGYYCISQDNSLYLYTYSGTAVFGDTPIVFTAESDLTEENLTTSITSLTNDDLGFILDTMNCITLVDACNVISKVRELLKDCNCN